MRGIKGILAGAAIVTALLATASLGVGSASAATELCTVNSSPSPCPAADVYPSGSKFTVTGEASFSKIGGCGFVYNFVTGASSGSPLAAKITSFTFSHCSPNFTATPLLNPTWMFPITVTGTGPNGTAEMLNATGGPPKIEIVSTTLGTCTYDASSIPQNITGGGGISVSGATLTLIAGGGGCPGPISLSTGSAVKPTFYVTN